RPMKLDRWIALLFLIGSIIYGMAAFNYPLLPFERNMAFLPNTLPIALSVLGATVSVFILLTAGPSSEDSSVITIEEVKQFKLGQTVALVVSMVLYAVLLRPIGFIAATSLFIVGSGALLGERKLWLLIPIALVATLLVWYLVQQTLGIYLRPWPAFVN
ncbi:MAG: tripartite tricarboxylate transporter TctB family protein, partial [bacterium]